MATTKPPQDQSPAADATPATTTTLAPEPPADESFKRPVQLWFIGERLPNGEPVAHLGGYGVDARDFPPGDSWYPRLTDEQVKLALDSGLYQRTKPKGRDDQGGEG